jgi:hypothetical protein
MECPFETEMKNKSGLRVLKVKNRMKYLMVIYVKPEKCGKNVVKNVVKIG